MKLHERFIRTCAGFFANAFDWYEFCIFAYLSNILWIIFFPKNSPSMAFLKIWAIFAIGYLIRPFGGLILGYYSDKIGIRKVFISALLGMSLPTIFIGLLPNYLSVGHWGGISLIILRSIQGFSAGAEFPLGLCYFTENIPHSRKSFQSSIVATSSLTGILLSSIVAFLLFSFFSHQELINFYWRLPFLLSVPLSLWIFFSRYQLVQETQSLDKETDELPEKINMINGIAIVSGMQIIFYVLIIWLPAHAAFNFVLPPEKIYLINIPAILIMGVLILVGGILMDKRINPLYLFKVSGFLMLILAIPCFLLLKENFFLFQGILSAVLGIFDSATMVLLIRTFNQKNRYLLISICFTIGATLGGLAPIATEFLTRLGTNQWAPASMIIFGSTLGLLGTYKLTQIENRHRSKLRLNPPVLNNLIKK